MMKKLLLIGTMFLILGKGARAQDTCASVMVVDTLHYYFNKYYFKTGQTTYTNFPFYKSAAATVTNVTHVGSMFENANNSLTVTGLEAYCAKPITSASPKIPLRMYLCNLNSNNMPDMPPVDSVDADVTSAHVNAPGIVGGPLKNGPKVMSGNYAVLLRNLSLISGDTVWVLRTAGLTPTYVATPAGWTSERKYSDDRHAYVRYLGNFYNTKDFTLAPGFGVGTEYEFMVAPRVQYTVQAGHAMSQNLIDFRDSPTPNDTSSWECARSSVFSFTNISSYQFTNRFFNLNEFYRKWNLYYPFPINAQPIGGWSADSSITWNFEFRENEMPNGDGRVFLKFGTNGPIHNISVQTSLGGCWDNAFRASLRPMSAFGRQPQIQCSVPFRVCLRFCDDAEGLSENRLAAVKLAPNPLDNGISTISHLSGRNQILVTTLLGQEVMKKQSDGAEFKLDLSQQPAGTYLLRISNAEGFVRTMKVVK